MDIFSELFKLRSPTTGEIYFMFWFFGLVGGYCIGRIHAALRVLNRWIDENGEL